MVKNLPAMQETWIQSLGQEDALGKGKATHSSILAWRIPRTEEPGRLQSIGCKELDTTKLLTLFYTHTHIYTHARTQIWAFLVAQTVKNLPAMQETPVQSLD